MNWNWLLVEAYCMYENVSTEDKIRVIVYKGKGQEKKEGEELENVDVESFDKEVKLVDNPMKKKEKKKPEQCPGRVCYKCFEIECPFLAMGRGRWNDIGKEEFEAIQKKERLEGYREDEIQTIADRLRAENEAKTEHNKETKENSS